MSDNDYADLRALAEELPREEWEVYHSLDAETFVAVKGKGPFATIAEPARWPDDYGSALATWIAAASPARILALLADLDAARAEAGRLRVSDANHREMLYEPSGLDTLLRLNPYARERWDALAAKVEAVRALIEQHARPSQTWAGMPLREGGVTLSELRRAVGGTA